MEVVASQPPDSPLALLQQPTKKFDASTPPKKVATSEQLPSPSAPSIEPSLSPSFAPAALRPAPSSKPTQHRSPRSLQAAIAPQSQFQDIQAHWSQPFVELLAARGIVSGYGDGTFQPDRQIEAAHFGLMLRQAKLYRFKAVQRDLGIRPNSVTEPQGLIAAAISPVTEAEAERLLRANGIRTRAQAAVFIYRNFQSQNAYSAIGQNATHFRAAHFRNVPS